MPDSGVAATPKTCQRCGVGFGCSMSGGCWCDAEAPRLPLPKPGVSQWDDCLCQACLRATAAEHVRRASGG